jgi:hypothetical protein
LVNERWIVQISGKMLIASSRTIVGAMNSHAIAPIGQAADAPRQRLGRGACGLVEQTCGSGAFIIDAS